MMKKIILFTMLLMLSVMFTSCFQHFYKTNTQKSIEASSLQKLQLQQKVFIVHLNTGVRALNKITIAGDNLEGDLIAVPQNHIAHINPDPDYKHHFIRRKYLSDAIKEVHLYYPEKLDSNKVHLSAPVSAFNRIDVYEFDQKATKSNRLVSIIGLTLAALWLSAVVLAASSGVWFRLD